MEHVVSSTTKGHRSWKTEIWVSVKQNQDQRLPTAEQDAKKRMDGAKTTAEV